MKTLPAKYLYELRDERVGKGLDLPLLSVSLYRGVVPRSEMTDAEPRADDLSNYKLCRPNEIVINRMSAFQGAIGISHCHGIVSPEYLVLRPHDDVDARFLTYLMKSAWFVGEMTARIRGIGSADQGNVRTPRINPSDLGSILVSVPSLTLQQAAADFLDAETVRIDSLITKKRHLIALVVERLRTFITVLTEDGPDIQVRHLISLRTSGPRGWADLVGETGAPFIRSANLQRDSIEIKTGDLVCVTPPMTEEARRSAVHNGDVLVGITGANTGWVGCVHGDLESGFVSQHVAILRPASVEPEWLAYSLFSQRTQDQLLGSQYGGTKQQLSLDDLAELRIACPDREEQQRRTKAMANAHAATKKMVTLLEGQIELLRERRQALITAVITGELKIPAQEAAA